MRSRAYSALNPGIKWEGSSRQPNAYWPPTKAEWCYRGWINDILRNVTFHKPLRYKFLGILKEILVLKYGTIIHYGLKIKVKFTRMMKNLLCVYHDSGALGNVISLVDVICAGQMWHSWMHRQYWSNSFQVTVLTHWYNWVPTANVQFPVNSTLCEDTAHRKTSFSTAER